MRQREYHACLVHFLVAVAAQLVHLPGVCHNQKTGEVVFVGFDTFLQHLHAVTFGGGFGTNGSMSSQVFFPDDFRTESGVLAFHYLDAGMLSEELTALHQGDGVGVYFRDVVPILVGQANKAMRDAQFVFAYNLCAALAQEFIVVQQASCNRIFYCQHAYGLTVLFDSSKYVLEAGAADKLYFFSFEVLVCGNVVIRT